MKIIKRNGSEVPFDINKISAAIAAANAEVPEDARLTERQIMYASANVADMCEAAGHTVSVEEIQDLVEDEIMRLDRFEVARKYIIYRYVQGLKRHKNTTDDQILSRTTRKSNRRTRTRTPRSCRCSATTWPARFRKTSRCASCFPPRSSTRIAKASSTSTTPTISRSTCTTATSSTSMTCCKTARSSRVRSSRSRIAFPRLATSPRRSSRRWPAANTAASRFRSRTWRRSSTSAVRRSAVRSSTS